MKHDRPALQITPGKLRPLLFSGNLGIFPDFSRYTKAPITSYLVNRDPNNELSNKTPDGEIR